MLGGRCPERWDELDGDRSGIYSPSKNIHRSQACLPTPEPTSIALTPSKERGRRGHTTVQRDREDTVYTEQHVMIIFVFTDAKNLLFA